MAVKGIDVSYAQGSNIDWHAVYRSGVRFVYFKVNEGDLIDKTTTLARVNAAKRAGLLVGGYNFVHPRSTRRGSTEFNIFYKRAKALGLLDKGTLRPMLDFENTHTNNFLTRTYVSSWIKACVKTARIHPVIYTGYYFWNQFGFKTDFNCPLWLAAYGVTQDWVKKHVPKPFDHAAFWQYTDSARVPGVPGKVDGDLYLGRDVAQLKRLHTHR
jgi:lysozyme